MHLLIVDVTWYRKSLAHKWIPKIKIYNQADKQIQSIDLEDYNFIWILSNDRKCVGYYEKESYVSCPFNNTIDNKFSSQCSYCEGKTGFKDAFIFRREPNENIKEYIYSNHKVYIAYFYPDIVKVGTAVENRNEKRLIEQDAQSYTFIAEKQNAIAIQDLESKIAKELNLRLAIPSRLKKKQLYNSDKQSVQKLKRVINQIYDKDDLNWELFPKEKLEFVNLSENYFYFDTEVQFLEFEDQEFTLFGKFIALRGKYLVIENHGKNCAFDTRNLIGRKITGYSDSFIYKLQDERMTLF